MNGFPPTANYLFFGNYVDCDKMNLKTICLCLAYKIKYPENFFMLRGSHECATINRVYDFYDECKARYSVRLWEHFIHMMNCMPVAAIIDEKVMCMSGGLSPDLISMDQIRRIMRSTDVSSSFHKFSYISSSLSYCYWVTTLIDRMLIHTIGSWLWVIKWSSLIRSLLKYQWLGWKWSRNFLHFRSWCREKILCQARPQSYRAWSSVQLGRLWVL